ncbi:MAG: UdgX family uracil-DNA binding protein [Gammaproteobacteria bacterium]
MAAQAKSLRTVQREAAGCRRCHLWKAATQTVFGEGPTDARLILIGEQPGDREDIEGRPFVGPAGAMLEKALIDAKVHREDVYITNAVKHFKFKMRGKRRLHQKPNAHEIERCRWWLGQELALLEPVMTMAMGTTAARALLGRTVTISRMRGKVVKDENERACMVTVHPSYLLRIPDAKDKKREYKRFVDDLAIAREHLSAS